MIGESPVNIECKVEQVLELGSHHMFLAKVVAVHADEAYMDERGRFDLNRAKPICVFPRRVLWNREKAGNLWLEREEKIENHLI